jgi:hypothetical protein
MSSKIGKLIKEVIERFDKNELELAFLPLCVAVDRTASREYPGMSNSRSYKSFLETNLSLITRVSFGSVQLLNSWRIAYTDPDPDSRLKIDAEGKCSFVDLLYHIIRCGSVHQGELPPNVRFAAESPWGTDNKGGVILPRTLIQGLIAAVVASPVNSSASIDRVYSFNLDGKELVIDDAWGNKDAILKLFEKDGRWKGITIGSLGGKIILNKKKAF